jgi:hypothetical protein
VRVPKAIVVNGDDEQAGYFLNFWSESKLACTFDPEKDERFFGKSLPTNAQVKDFIVCMVRSSLKALPVFLLWLTSCLSIYISWDALMR